MSWITLTYERGGIRWDKILEEKKHAKEKKYVNEREEERDKSEGGEEAFELPWPSPPHVADVRPCLFGKARVLWFLKLPLYLPYTLHQNDIFLADFFPLVKIFLTEKVC